MNINFLKEKFRKIFLREWETLDSVLWFAMGVFAAALILVMFWESATLTIGGLLGISDKADILKFIGLGMGGLLAALGAIALNRRAEAQIKSADAQADVAAEQAKNNRLTEKGHVQDRFKAAVEHLGSERAEMKIAAYHELYQLAREGKENSDLRRIIFEILCAHLRQLTNASEYKKNHGKYKPTEGVQTLLDLLFKSEDSKAIFQGLKANLQRVYLVGADLRDAWLCGHDFTGAWMPNAKFSGAQLQNACLTDAKMQMACLENVNLRGTYMQKTILHYANMRNADIRGAMCTAELHCAELDGMRAGGTTPNGSYLSFEDMIKTRIGQEGDLTKCQISGHSQQYENWDGVYSEGKGAPPLSGLDAHVFSECMQNIVGEEHAPEPIEYLDKGICASDIIITPYTQTDAEQWIAEYKEATGETSDDGK